MPLTVLYPEALYADQSVENEVYGPEIGVVVAGKTTIAELTDQQCAEADGLMILRQPVTAADFARFKQLRVVLRMGVGYDKLDRKAAAARNVMVCNVPDYGTTEVADHTLALVLALRRGLLLHHAMQRKPEPAGWRYVDTPLVERLSAQRFGIVGIGRIGPAVALRAKAFGFHVMAFDPYQPNGVELAIGVERFGKLEDMLRQANVLAVHAPLTVETRGLLGPAHTQLLPQ